MNQSPANTADRDRAQPGFAGSEPQPVDRALAVLVDDNYDLVDVRRGRQIDPAKEPVQLPAGWSRVSDDDLRARGIDPALQSDAKSGFDASFYRDGDGNVALVYAGSDEGKDWKHNFGQGLGFKDAQYDQAIALAREAKLAFGDQLVLTGQSLGGGLAAAAAMVNEVPAVTFNAAGVHDKTLERYDMDAQVLKQQANAGLVRHYVVENEILTHLQENAFPLNLAMPDAPGARINLPDPDPLSGFDRILPWKTWPHRVENHYIEAVISAMDKAGYGLSQGESAVPEGQATATRLLGDAVREIGPQRDHLGLQDDTRFLNTAAGVAACAGRDGLRCIDHVVPGTDRTTVFAVAGGLQHSDHLRSRIDVGQVSTTPADLSTADLRIQAATSLANPVLDQTLAEQNKRQVSAGP